MKKSRFSLILALSVVLLAGCSVSVGTSNHSINAQERYEPNWNSLRRHDTPDWADGMKFGIYCHWGAQTVQNANPNEEWGRIEAIEHWKGENFDAKAWVDLFEAAGAQFAGPVAWHVTGLVNWNSDLTDWNSVNHGPKVDISGELAKEIRKRDMKLLMSFHSSAIWGTVSNSDSTYIEPEKSIGLMGPNMDARGRSDLWQGWLDRMTEAVDKYQPDFVWADVGFGGTVKGVLKKWTDRGRMLPGQDNTINGISEENQQKFLAHYFNKGLEWNKDVEFIYKSFDIPPGIGMRDIENGSLAGLQYDPWMTDINMAHHYAYPSPWFYNPENPMKDANHLIDLLIDVTSKNGRMLLSVPPLPDGTFTADQKKQLTAMGNWLKVNGEAIYDTIPWTFFGEGPTEERKPGHHSHGKDENIPSWTAADIRFTQNGKNLYAIVMDWPGEQVSIRALGSHGKLYPDDILSVSIVGTDNNIEWNQTPDALTVQFPEEKPCDFAYVIKIVRK